MIATRPRGNRQNSAMHPHAEITTALRYLLHLQRYARPIRRDREQGAEVPLGGQSRSSRVSVMTWKRRPPGPRYRGPGAASPRQGEGHGRTPPPCPSSVQPCDQSRRQPSEIQRQAAQVAQRAAVPALALPLLGRGDRRQPSAINRRRPRRRTRSTSSISGSDRTPPTSASRSRWISRPWSP